MIAYGSITLSFIIIILCKKRNKNYPESLLSYKNSVSSSSNSNIHNS